MSMLVLKSDVWASARFTSHFCFMVTRKTGHEKELLAAQNILCVYLVRTKPHINVYKLSPLAEQKGQKFLAAWQLEPSADGLITCKTDLQMLFPTPDPLYTVKYISSLLDYFLPQGDAPTYTHILGPFSASSRPRLMPLSHLHTASWLGSISNIY